MHSKVNRERIKILRLGKSWTQQKLADVAGISLRSVQRIEGEGTASLHSRMAIATAFGIEPMDLDLDIESTDNNNQVDGRKPDDTTMTMIVALSLFIFSSLYFGFAVLDIPLNNLNDGTVVVVALIPAFTLLLFGLILQAPLSNTRQRLLTIIGCILLSMALTPPDPTIQLVTTFALWILFEVSVFCSRLITKGLITTS